MVTAVIGDFTGSFTSLASFSRDDFIIPSPPAPRRWWREEGVGRALSSTLGFKALMRGQADRRSQSPDRGPGQGSGGVQGPQPPSEPASGGGWGPAAALSVEMGTRDKQAVHPEAGGRDGKGQELQQLPRGEESLRTQPPGRSSRGAAQACQGPGDSGAWRRSDGPGLASGRTQKGPRSRGLKRGDVGWTRGSQDPWILGSYQPCTCWCLGARHPPPPLGSGQS